MKQLQYLIFTVLSICFLGCANGKSDKTVAKTQSESDSISIKKQEMKDFRIKTLESFLSVDEETVADGENIYFQLLQKYSDKEPTKEDSLWYRKNIVHIDSVARHCIELSKKDDDKQLLNVLESELPNFQSHPNADSYIFFDLNMVLTELYFDQSDIHPDYLQKCIDLWELNRLKLNLVQSGKEEYHPLYLESLKILSRLYEKADNKEKVAEIEAMINDVTDANAL